LVTAVAAAKLGGLDERQIHGTKDGRSLTREGTGREFIWNFEEEARRIPPRPGLAVSYSQFADLIDTCRQLDRHDRAAHSLIALTVPG
jgi:hypothetical protein